MVVVVFRACMWYMSLRRLHIPSSSEAQKLPVLSHSIIHTIPRITATTTRQHLGVFPETLSASAISKIYATELEAKLQRNFAWTDPPKARLQERAMCAGTMGCRCTSRRLALGFRRPQVLAAIIAPQTNCSVVPCRQTRANRLV